MSLALQFGCSLEQLEEDLTERELQAWATYHALHGLPQHRTEIMLARVCAQIAWSVGAKDVKVSDFMIKREEVPDVITPDDIKQAFKFSPRKKRGRSR